MLLVLRHQQLLWLALVRRICCSQKILVTIYTLIARSSIGVGASQGILVKGGEPLEGAQKIRTIVFDKTGTITQGKPTVIDTRLFVPNDAYWSIKRMLAIAGTAESGSEHPLGKAIRAYCKDYYEWTQLGRCEDFNVIWGY